jgi:F-type H+-transporting ATPase subunit delta
VKTAPAVSRSYAKALFELARERNQTDAIARELEAIAKLLDVEAELRAFFARPWVAATVKRNAAAELATRLGVSPLTRDFLALVAARGRTGHFRAIVAAFGELQDGAAGRARARVRTAMPLSATERASLSERLGRVLEGRQVVLEEVVDRDLLGGFVAEIGSLLVDGSLNGQLARLRDRLVKG